MKHTETKTQSFQFTRKELLDMIFTDLHVRQNISIPEKDKEKLYDKGGFNINGMDENDSSNPDCNFVTGFNVKFTQEIVRGNERSSEGVVVIDEEKL